LHGKQLGATGSAHQQATNSAIVACILHIFIPFEPEQGQLHAEPHVQPISCHVTSLLWQELEEEWNKLLLMNQTSG